MTREYPLRISFRKMMFLLAQVLDYSLDWVYSNKDFNWFSFDCSVVTWPIKI